MVIMVLLMVQNLAKMFQKAANGCTDSNALNYDEHALCDNGSCA